MTKKFEPGTKVIATIQYPDEYSDEEEKIVKYIVDEYDDYTLVGVVRSQPASAGKVWVKWIEGEREGEEEEIDVKVLSLESAKSDLEKEFKVVEKQIKEKMKTAAALIKEANKMAKAAGARNLQDMYEASSPLVSAMDSSGWRSSSWGC